MRSPISGQGIAFFNDVAVAVPRCKLKVERDGSSSWIATYIGDGTAAIFADDSSVFHLLD